METGSHPRWQSWEGRGWLGLEGQRSWVTAEKSHRRASSAQLPGPGASGAGPRSSLGAGPPPTVEGPLGTPALRRTAPAGVGARGGGSAGQLGELEGDLLAQGPLPPRVPRSPCGQELAGSCAGQCVHGPQPPMQSEAGWGLGRCVSRTSKH